MKRTIILASQSPRRIQLLHQIGIEAVVMPDRRPELITSSDPETVVRQLSAQKAGDIAGRVFATNTLSSGEAVMDAVVIGADTVVSIDGKILGKPQTHEEAAAMICELSGRAHQVFTGVTVISQEGTQVETENFVEKTIVHVAAMTEEEIQVYANSSEPMDKAGAYGIQGTFAKYITGIEGDYYNVVGLPVAHLYQILKNLDSHPER